ncbi:KH homology domain-containing protein 4 [Culex quinquefasciatus]|uniref:KH homology domain-containing protein 4 n=1 Tax=Culex quinquefasciatus TaxID=7176 RepID=UPI0018E3C347|nr:KH homology domain-containing protein 4 [Culex quinquefasciatus]
MKIAKGLSVWVVVISCLLVTASAAVKKKRGLYHGLQGYSIPLGLGAHRPYLGVVPYAKHHHGYYKGFGGVLPPGYGLFPGNAAVTSYQQNFPKVPAYYAPSYLPPVGAGFLRPNYAPIAPVAPAAPVTPVAPVAPAFPLGFGQFPAAQAPAYFPLGNPQQTSFFATYPQKPIIPVAIPAPEKPKVPVVFQKPIFTAFSNLLPNGVIPTGVYNPSVAVQNGPVAPTFVGIPINGGPTAATPTTISTVVTQQQQPWRPVLVNHHPTPSPPTTVSFKPSLSLLPPYSPAQQGQQQYFISSTPSPHTIQDSQHQQQQTLLDLEQGQEDGNGAFNGQPYDVASNHGRYSGPSSYDVDITHNGYQKKKK